MNVKSPARVVLSLLFALAVSNCSYISHDVPLDPKLNISEEELGYGTLIALEVVDERVEEVIGYRSHLGDVSAEIVTNDNVAKVFREKIEAFLVAKGFEIAQSGEEVPHRLRVEVWEISFRISREAWTDRERIRVVLKGTGSGVADAEYDELHTALVERRILFVPTEGSNVKRINATAAKALRLMMKHEKFRNFLEQAGKPATERQPTEQAESAPEA